MNPRFLLLAFSLLPMPAAEPAAGLITLLEGPLHVIRNTEQLGGVEGMSLRPGDILETGDKGFVQMEFADGGIVALGPATRLYLLRVLKSASAKTTAPMELVLLRGWLKGQANGAPYTYESPAIAASASTGTVILHREDQACAVFVEAGAATISGVSPDGALRQAQAVKAGQFYSCRADKSLNSAPRPTAAFVDSLPPAFRDTLPPRAAHFAGKAIEPKVVRGTSYAELESWLTMPTRWRRGFASRFTPKLKDPEFRKEIEAHLSQFPEWRPILYPEKNPPGSSSTAIPSTETPQPRP
ncbi:MAG TPA: hypothetical protein VK525_09945 [Candidatus Saccharimonadales bacterium]|nr:hypothetical protein [Candidatus Saccharimonadales bacterium]